MKINLRKASIVQDLLRDEVRQLRQEPSKVDVSLFEDQLCEHVDRQLSSFQDAQSKIERYLEAWRDLRVLVARHNVETGVHELLGEDSMLSHRLATLDVATCSAQARLSDEAIRRQAERLKGQEDLEITMSLDVSPARTLDEMKAKMDAIRRRRRKIKDQLLNINVKTDFEVPERVVTVLEELGLD